MKTKTKKKTSDKCTTSHICDNCGKHSDKILHYIPIGGIRHTSNKRPDMNLCDHICPSCDSNYTELRNFHNGDKLFFLPFKEARLKNMTIKNTEFKTKTKKENNNIVTSPPVPYAFVIALKGSKHELVTKFILYLFSIGFKFIPCKSMYDLNEATNDSQEYILINIPTKYVSTSDIVDSKGIFNFSDNDGLGAFQLVYLRENYDWLKYVCKTLADNKSKLPQQPII